MAAKKNGKSPEAKKAVKLPAGFVKKNSGGRVEGKFLDLKPGTTVHGILTDAFSYRSKLNKKQTAVYILKTKDGYGLVSEKVSIAGMRDFILGTEVFMSVGDYKKLPRGRKLLEIDLYAKDDTAPKKGKTSLDAMKEKRFTADSLEKALGISIEDALKEEEGTEELSDVPF